MRLSTREEDEGEEGPAGRGGREKIKRREADGGNRRTPTAEACDTLHPHPQHTNIIQTLKEAF